MSHASSLEKCKLALKKVRAGKRKRKLQEAELRIEMGTEEYENLKRENAIKSLKQKVMTAIWDYEKKQYPLSKYNFLEKLLQERLSEIAEPKDRLELEEKRKIEVVLNELSG